MQNGLYQAALSTNGRIGTGVVVLNEGLVRGGDSSMFYTGTYTTDLERITAKIFVRPHTDVDTPVLGIPSATLTLVGSLSGDQIELRGHVAELPTTHVKINLRRLSD